MNINDFEVTPSEGDGDSKLTISKDINNESTNLSTYIYVKDKNSNTREYILCRQYGGIHIQAGIALCNTTHTKGITFNDSLNFYKTSSIVRNQISSKEYNIFVNKKIFNAVDVGMLLVFVNADIVSEFTDNELSLSSISINNKDLVEKQNILNIIIPEFNNSFVQLNIPFNNWNNNLTDASKIEYNNFIDQLITNKFTGKLTFYINGYKDNTRKTYCFNYIFE